MVEHLPASLIINLFSIFLIRESNPFLSVCRVSFVLNNDILVCFNSLQIFSKSAFLFGFGVYVDSNLTIDSAAMLLFR